MELQVSWNSKFHGNPGFYEAPGFMELQVS